MSLKKLEISTLMDGYPDEEFGPKEDNTVDVERVKDRVSARIRRGRLKKRRIILAAAVLAVCLGLAGWTYGERIYHLLGGGQVTIGGGAGMGYGEVQMSDGYDEDGQPLVISLEEGRLWFVARGQRVDITDRVDEKTPYVDTWRDEEGNLYYVMAGGTPENYGWYQGVIAPDGSGGGSGIASSRTDIPPEELSEPQWLTSGREQVRQLWAGEKDMNS